MKRIFYLTLAGLLMVASLGASLASAEDMGGQTEAQEPGMMQDGKGSGMHMLKGKKSHKKGMMGKMGDAFASCPVMGDGGAQMVSVGDGVVVLIGNKLIKYDKNLNVVKEAVIKMNEDDVKSMMQGCPMMKMMGGEGKGASSGDVSEEKVDHSAHH